MCNEDAERLRAERKAKRRAYYLANREQFLALAKAYKAANREKQLAYSAAYREANKEQRKAANKAYHAANRERRLASLWPPAVPPGSSPDERRLPFPPAAAPARLHGAVPHLRSLAGVVRQHHHADPLRRHAQEGRSASSGTGPATSTAARTSPATTAAPSATPRSPCCTR